MPERYPSIRQYLRFLPFHGSNPHPMDGGDRTVAEPVDYSRRANVVTQLRPAPVILHGLRGPAKAATARPLAVSVVIPHLNEPDHLLRCLRSLDRQRDGGVAFEVIVVDNGSREPVAPICRLFKGVRLVTEPEPGPGPARNLGARLARGEIIAFIDADCVAQKNWLRAIRQAFRDPDVDVLGGDIRILIRAARKTAIEAYEDVYSYRARLFVERHGYAATGNMAVRAEVFRRVGPFRGLGTHEDVVWGRKAREAGYHIVFRQNVTVSTDACESFEALARRLDRLVIHSRNDTWPRGQLKWVVKTGIVFASPLLEIPRILTNDRLKGARERLAVFGVIVRARLYRARLMAALWHGQSGTERLVTWNRE